MRLVPGGRVRLPSGRKKRVGAFLLDERPVTNADWEAFVQATGARRPHWMYRPGFGDLERPVVGVSYGEARAYARWAGKRLPSELEWLRAARGDDQRPYPWGEARPDGALAHFGKGGRGGPAPCDQAQRRSGAGPFGHHDLVGNVWEWCEGGVLKGGFWGSWDPLIDLRRVERPDAEAGGVGFRCAL